jgi:hypothetical protein
MLSDERPWLAVDDSDLFMRQPQDISGDEESRGADAARRAEKSRRIIAELAASRDVSKQHVVMVNHQASEAHIRARRGHLAAAEQHRRAAEVHARAAEIHSRAAAAGIGDVATHLEAVGVYRAARDSEYRAADRELRLVERQ